MVLYRKDKKRRRLVVNVDVGKKEKSCRDGRCDLDCCMVSMKCIHEENGRGTYDGKGEGALDPVYLLP